MGQFHPNMAQSILAWKGFRFVQMEGPLFPNWDNNKIQCTENTSTKFNRNLFLQWTTGLISSWQGTKHPWIKGIQLFTEKDHLIFKKEMIIFFLIWSTHCLAQMCLLIVTQVSDVTHGPRVSLSYFNLLVYSWLYCTCHTCTRILTSMPFFILFVWLIRWFQLHIALL